MTDTPKIGATIWSQEIGNAMRSIRAARRELERLKTMGKGNAEALGRISQIAIEIGNIQDAIVHLKEIGDTEKYRRLKERNNHGEV
jgi:hypothetical protein